MLGSSIPRKIVIGATLILFGLFMTHITFLQNSQTNDNAPLDCGFTQNFYNFIKNSQKYSAFGFQRSDLKCACYGGKSTATQKLKKTPVIFIHGNSDIGFGRGTQDGNVAWQTGFRSLATYLTAEGYSERELYTTTWGFGNANLTSQNYHGKKYVLYMRAFVQAVLQYTQANQVNIIAHSMGVTLGRKVIKGGIGIDHIVGNYSIGESLANKVHSFVGLAGGNYGLTQCFQASIVACNKIDGFNPGDLPSSGPSKYLNDMNTDGQPQGQKVYTIWSKYDSVIGIGGLVWGKYTCRIPNQTSQIIKTTQQWDHFAIRDNTGSDFINWL